MKSEICSSFGEGKSYYKTCAEYAGCQVVYEPASLYCLSLWSQLGHPGSSAGLGSVRSRVQGVVGPGVIWAHLSRRCLEWLGSAPIFNGGGGHRQKHTSAFQPVSGSRLLIVCWPHQVTCWAKHLWGAELESEWGRSLQNRTGLPCCLPQVLLSGPVTYSRILGALTLSVFDPLCLFRQ